MGSGTKTIIASKSYLLQPEENSQEKKKPSVEKGRIKTVWGFPQCFCTEKEGWKAEENISGFMELKRQHKSNQ